MSASATHQRQQRQKNIFELVKKQQKQQRGGNKEKNKNKNKNTANKKKPSEYLKVVKITGDGRCMFRAVALGLAHASKRNITKTEETEEADTLRMACFEQMCKTEEKRRENPEASMAVKYGEGGLESYCRRLQREDFWGGEVELLIVAKMIKRPIKVYLPAHMVKNAASRDGFLCIQTYGEAFAERTSKRTGKKIVRDPIKLCYDGAAHYDLLI